MLFIEEHNLGEIILHFSFYDKNPGKGQQKIVIKILNYLGVISQENDRSRYDPLASICKPRQSLSCKILPCSFSGG